MQGRNRRLCSLVCSTAMAWGLVASSASASSHMDAPLITLDDAANTTDVYAFVSERDGRPYLTTALAVNPFEEPGIGPNAYRFDDDVRYEIHVATGDDVAAGRPTYTYRFEFETEFTDPDTILQSFRGVIGSVGDGNQNLTQTYRVTRLDKSTKGRPMSPRVLGEGIVPPNNQGLVTPLYNQDGGSGPAKDGVDRGQDLDPYTEQAIAELDLGYLAFAGQRDDGFYADIQAIFEGLAFRQGDDRFDSQGGFNLRTIVLNIPLEEIGGSQQVVGVYATTLRPRGSVVRGPEGRRDGRFVQVGRQGNPLFAEGFIAIADKDLYNRTAPSRDRRLFERYALEPELAIFVNAAFGPGTAIETERTDLAGIFIPDVIKVDLSTGPARLAGGGPVEESPDNPDDPNFSRLGIFGNDVLQSQVQAGLFGNGTVPGGWPNGRRFGDDVVDIAVSALVSDLRPTDPADLVIVVQDGIDNVNENEIAFNKVFPYAATPLSGRNHAHHQ